jgi:hypothetical protein
VPHLQLGDGEVVGHRHLGGALVAGHGRHPDADGAHDRGVVGQLGPGRQPAVGVVERRAVEPLRSLHPS